MTAIADLVYFCRHDIDGPEITKMLSNLPQSDAKSYRMVFRLRQKKVTESLIQEFGVPFCYMIVAWKLHHSICVPLLGTEERRAVFEYVWDLSPIAIAKQMWKPLEHYLNFEAIFNPHRLSELRDITKMELLQQKLKERFVFLMEWAYTSYLDKSRKRLTKKAPTAPKHNIWLVFAIQNGHWSLENIPTKNLLKLLVQKPPPPPPTPLPAKKLVDKIEDAVDVGYSVKEE